MGKLFNYLSILLALTVSAFADDRPSWAVTDAVNRLIAKNALFLPGGDGFVKSGDGRLFQYEHPEKSYTRNDTKSWQVTLLSRRLRENNGKQWKAWALPTGEHWRIGEIRVDVLTSGVNATWADGRNFIGQIAPSQSEVTQKLDTASQGYISKGVMNPVLPTPPDLSAEESRRSERTATPSPDSGMFRKGANGVLQRVTPAPVSVLPSPGVILTPSNTQSVGIIPAMQHFPVAETTVVKSGMSPDYLWPIVIALFATGIVGAILIVKTAPKP